MKRHNPIEKAYKILVDYRDNNGELDIDEAIGSLGTALDDNAVIDEFASEESVDELLQKKSGIGTSEIHRLLSQSGYIACKLWREEDIAYRLEENGFEPTQSNIDNVVNTGFLKNLEECTESDWLIIDHAIYECGRRLI